MANPILQTAALIGAGTVGAMAARSIRLPAAAGSLIAAAAFVWGRHLVSPDAGRPDLTFLLLMLLAFMGLLAGACVDLNHLVRNHRGIVTGFVSRAVLVFGTVWLTGIGLGLDSRSAAILGAAATALSPAAVIAVTTQVRSRGDLTQDLLATAPSSLMLALLSVLLLAAPSRAPILLGGILIAGVLAGLVIVVPLSRMARRGSILAASGGAAALLAGVSTHLGASTGSVMLASALAGFMAGNLIPNRAIVRDALSDAGTPAAIVLFALGASIVAVPEPATLITASVLVVGARLAGLLLPGILTGRGAAGVASAAARLPMPGMLAASALAIASAGSRSPRSPAARRPPPRGPHLGGRRHGHDPPGPRHVG